MLFVNPIVSAASVQRAVGVSAPTARATIRALEVRGMVPEITGRTYGRVFRAEELLHLLRREDVRS